LKKGGRGDYEWVPINYSNGITEGINSKIKLIKRVSFDYSSFYHLREHIYIIQGFIYN